MNISSVPHNWRHDFRVADPRGSWRPFGVGGRHWASTAPTGRKLYWWLHGSVLNRSVLGYKILWAMLSLKWIRFRSEFAIVTRNDADISSIILQGDELSKISDLLCTFTVNCNLVKVVNDALKMTMEGAMAALYGFRSFQKLLKMKLERSMSFVLYVSLSNLRCIYEILWV